MYKPALKSIEGCLTLRIRIIRATPSMSLQLIILGFDSQKLLALFCGNEFGEKFSPQLASFGT